MAIDVRFIQPNEIPRLRDVLSVAFGGGDVNSDWDPVWENVFEPDRMLAAEETGDMVGVAGTFSFTMTIPGGDLPVAGLTIVGVLPTHRRKGILNALMEKHIADAVSHGEPVSALWASEEVIYQRFGYGPATSHIQIAVDRAHRAFRNDPGPSGRPRLLDDEESLKVLPDVYERARRNTPGMLARDPSWWQYHRLHDPKSDRDGASRLYRVVWEKDGGAEAYGLYRVKEKWDWATGINESELWVFEAVATSVEAHRELWRYIFGVDLVQKVIGYFMAVDDPLPLMVLEPRRLKRRVADALWLRVIDVAQAMTARTYAAEGTVTFGVRDRFCPWNEGAWRIAVDGDTRVEKVSDDPDLTLDAADLGAVYLGGTTFRELQRAGRVSEEAPGAITRADALFHTDRMPWCPEIF